MSLGTTISRLRAEQSLSQEELAEALGVSRQSISKWETDRSVPELDKLVKLGRLFGVTLDQLVLEESPAPEAPPPEPEAPPSGRGLAVRQVIGIVLLCMGFLAILVPAAMGGLLEGLLLSSPFLLCGAVCLLFRQRAGLWCGWTVYLLADLYLRLATGINWRLALHTLSFTPEQNYVRLAVGWGQLLGMLALIALTVFSFRKARIALSRRGRLWLLAGWAVLGLLSLLPVIPLVFAYFMAPLLLQALADGLRLALFTALLVFTLWGLGKKTG